MTACDHVDALFDSKYLRWFDLNGQPALVKITHVNDRVEMTLPGGAKSKKPVILFEQVNGRIKDVKPLVLNKTNGNQIASIHGPKPSGWIGKQIVIFQDATEMYDKVAKKMVTKECIRIRASKLENGS